MEEVLNEQINVQKKPKKTFTILGISIWRIIAFFIIYSVAGYVVEVLFSIVSKGTLESRQSFMYGPFSGIYGLGAVVMILFLQYFNKNNNRLFIGGFIVGSIVEYLVSLFAEVFLHVKWWDYSNQPLNINGRICVYFSIFWGFLAVYFMSYVHPKIERLMEKIKQKISVKKLKIITVIITVFLVFDGLITGYALEMFLIRKVHDYNLNVANKELIDEKYDEIYGSEVHAKVIDTFFNDRAMIKTFPNLKTIAANGDIIYFDQMVGGIEPYYYKFNFKKRQEQKEYNLRETNEV
ncbi:MAG: putative ABC transporter permease [Clostridia bacterium]|mgnify:CR=1 FL=1|nr:putative ABC transporter permease [Clostridia bacterium]MCI9275831.1 putative ABC transporter permease [Clostridia bacterium]